MIDAMCGRMILVAGFLILLMAPSGCQDGMKPIKYGGEGDVTVYLWCTGGPWPEKWEILWDGESAFSGFVKFEGWEGHYSAEVLHIKARYGTHTIQVKRKGVSKTISIELKSGKSERHLSFSIYEREIDLHDFDEGSFFIM